MKSLVFALTLVLAAPFAFSADGVAFESSFESPTVSARSPRAKGGDIAYKANKGGEWDAFSDSPAASPEAPGGGIEAGLTDEIVRTGNSSLYVLASSLNRPYAGVRFKSALFKIEPGANYTTSIWGRNDTNNPLIAKVPQLFLKQEIDFFTDAGQTQTGETQYINQPLPGGVASKRPMFVSTAWRQMKRRVTAPADAHYMTVTWKIDAGAEKGPVNGLIFFDDVSVYKDSGPKVDESGEGQELLQPVEPEAEPSPAPASSPAASPTPQPSASAALGSDANLSLSLTSSGPVPASAAGEPVGELARSPDAGGAMADLSVSPKHSKRRQKLIEH